MSHTKCGKLFFNHYLVSFNKDETMNIKLAQPYSFSQQGRRDYQEDSRWPANDTPSASQRFFIVCDGVGGSEHGEVASATVCKAFAKKMSEFSPARDFSNDNFSSVLDYAYAQLDKVGRNTKGDMATTLTFLCFHARGCTMAHIGDSRIYQVRPQQGIIYRSDDHSLVNSMVHNGVISPQQAENHPQRNVITRCMEPVDERQNRSQATLVRTDDILPGDFFLLCSDGALENITDDLLVDILSKSEISDKQKIDRIKQICLDSDDNNTAILVRVECVEQDKATDHDSLGNAEEDGENPDDSESTTRRFSREQRQAAEIESFQQQRQGGFLSKIKRIFTGD